jgi:hypothetical protein
VHRKWYRSLFIIFNLRLGEIWSSVSCLRSGGFCLFICCRCLCISTSIFCLGHCEEDGVCECVICACMTVSDAYYLRGSKKYAVCVRQYQVLIIPPSTKSGRGSIEKSGCLSVCKRRGFQALKW